VETTVVNVNLSEHSYPVFIGTGYLQTVLPSLIPSTARRAAIITQENIGIQVATGIEQKTFHIADGEHIKTLTTIEKLCSEWAEWGLTRSDFVVAVGGGLVTDVGGFAASVYHRGVEVIHIPTTLLGMVDAATGGKTAVNLPEGKNLVGSFWQPSAVICELETLISLPEREWRCGYGEMAKYHFIGSSDFRQLELVDQITHCVQFKADIVSEDERETGRRAILNYGHTLAHALELEKDFILAHGEAVAIGIRYAAEIARLLGRIDQDRVNEHESVLKHYGLSYTLPPSSDIEKLISLFSRDKKALGKISFVLDGPKGIELIEIDDKEILMKAMEALL
jgi:5-deoxy-5-amino-3-dehydroquinate synthase